MTSNTEIAPKCYFKIADVYLHGNDYATTMGRINLPKTRVRELDYLTKY